MRILTADDSMFQRRMISGLLRDDGYEALEAADGQSALETLETETCDCIILDLVMPKMNGIDVLKTLHQRGSTVPVIVVSADIQDSTLEECMELGAKAMIAKPIKADVLREKIHQVLGSDD